MATFLFDKIIFGPVRSRRLGISLGINLLPTDSKFCNFNCIYCECGWTPGLKGHKPAFHPRAEVARALAAKLAEMVAQGSPPDVITFAGNGEPTVHPEFEGIIADTLALRNQWVPACKVAVLTNATMLHKPTVVEALKEADQAILKLDSAIESTILRINGPLGGVNLAKLEKQFGAFGEKLIIQTMFLRGQYQGQPIDNTSPHELEAWLAFLQRIAPAQVMIYSIARDTPLDTLQKVPAHELEAIADRLRALNIPVQVSA